MNKDLRPWTTAFVVEADEVMVVAEEVAVQAAVEEVGAMEAEDKVVGSHPTTTIITVAVDGIHRKAKVERRDPNLRHCRVSPIHRKDLE